MDAKSTEQNQDTKSFGFLRWVLVALILFFIYFLSSGPAYRLADNRIISQEFVSVVYTPLDELCIQTEVSYRIYTWYFELWAAPSSRRK